MQGEGAGLGGGSEAGERHGIFAELGEGSGLRMKMSGMGAWDWLSTLSRGWQGSRDKTEDKGAKRDRAGSDTGCEGHKTS